MLQQGQNLTQFARAFAYYGENPLIWNRPRNSAVISCPCKYIVYFIYFRRSQSERRLAVRHDRKKPVKCRYRFQQSLYHAKFTWIKYSFFEPAKANISVFETRKCAVFEGQTHTITCKTRDLFYDFQLMGESYLKYNKGSTLLFAVDHAIILTNRRACLTSGCPWRHVLSEVLARQKNFFSFTWNLLARSGVCW